MNLRTRSISRQLKLPGILCDINGVLYSQKKAIERSTQALKCVLADHIDQKSGQKFLLPFLLVSNGGGGISENNRAIKVNKIMFSIFDQFPSRIRGEQIILCHTPLRRIAHQYEDKHVLIAGQRDCLQLAIDLGFQKAVLVQELIALLPQIYSINTGVLSPYLLDEYTQNILKRFGKCSKESLLNEFQFAAIIILEEFDPHQFHFQVFSDLIRSKDGRIGAGGKINYRDKTEPQYVQLFCCTKQELSNKERLDKQRLSVQFMLSLRNRMEEEFGITLKYTQFGKPETVTFEYAQELLQEKAQNQDAEISHIYMIGDKPQVDVLGANLMQAKNKNWSSILVQTGLYHPDSYELHKQKLEGLTKPTYEVKDMHDAIQLIFDKEGLNIKV